MDFRTALVGLAPFVTGTANLIDAADWVVANTPANILVFPNTQEGRVQAALADPETMQHMRDNKKIQAIKRLRTVATCGLREAKEACEDPRVLSAVEGRRQFY